MSGALKYLLVGTLAPSLVFAQTHKAPPTDWQIEAEIQKALAKDHIFVGSSIMSSVNQGVVKLTGNVRSETEKEYASSDLANIPGVKTVLNNLEVHDASAGIRATITAPPPPPPPKPTGPKTLTLTSGTMLPIRLTEELDTKTAKAGDVFHGITAAGISQNGFVLLPSGTPVIGRVIDAKAAGHFSGSAELALELVSIRQPGTDQDVSMLTQQLSSKANGRGANTVEKAGGGAALGAVVGAIAGGGTGAGIGAASGGALGLGANAITRGKEIDLKPEQLLQFRTAAPLDVKIMLVDGQQIIPAATPLQQRTPQQ